MKTDLLTLKKDELVTIAKKLKITGAHAMKKDALVATIQKAQKAATKSTAKKKVAKKTTVTAKTTVKKKAVTKKATKKTVAKKTVRKKGAASKAAQPKKKTTTGARKVTRKKVVRKKGAASAAPVSVPPIAHDDPVHYPAGVETKTIRYTTGDLPHTYHETKIVAIVRDPYWVFAYWDFSEDTHKYIHSLYEEYQGVRPVLRVHDVTGLSFNGSNANRNWDLDISLDAKNWYVNLGSPGASFVIDLGLKDKMGRFFLLARSNTIALPTDYPSSVIDEKWMISDVDFDELYALSGGFGVGLSSGDVKKRPRPQPFGLPELLSSGALSSSNLVAGEAKEKTFFLEVATELILYGRTHADAHLTVDNKKIQLRPDGTFSLRFFLPDGSLPLPVKAVSADGDDERHVKIKVDKETR